MLQIYCQLKSDLQKNDTVKVKTDTVFQKNTIWGLPYENPFYFDAK